MSETCDAIDALVADAARPVFEAVHEAAGSGDPVGEAVRDAHALADHVKAAVAAVSPGFRMVAGEAVPSPSLPAPALDREGLVRTAAALAGDIGDALGVDLSDTSIEHVVERMLEDAVARGVLSPGPG